MPTDEIEIMQIDVADAIGVDIVYLGTPDERHLDLASLLFGFASALLVAFTSGFVDESRKQAKKAGRDLAKVLSQRLSRVFMKKSEVAKKRELQAGSKKVKDKLKHATPEQIKKSTRVGETYVQFVLVANNFPPDKASALAKRVASIAMTRLIERQQEEGL